MAGDLEPLLGRDWEQEQLATAIRSARLGASTVQCIVGEPGIGKTALLDWTAAVAASEGMGVLSARGVEAESEVPFAGLLELLRPALGECHRIPEAQADALQSALDLGPMLEGSRFLVGAATLNLLSARAERAPLLVLIDDVQWIDEPSLAALLFAARRLVVDPIAVVFAARPDETPLLEAARLPTMTIEGLDAAAAEALVRRHASTPPDPAAIERLGRLTGGNPLALRELSGTGGGTSVVSAYGERIAALPDGTRRALTLAAAEESGRLDWIGAAAERLGLALADLEAAERAELVVLEYGALSWRHPLARSAAYEAAPADERRAVHGALAATAPADEADRRAWHLAAAALGPDEETAMALDAAGRRARGRSAYTTAAAASERAASLTGAGEPRARRLLAAAEAGWLGGDAKGALRRLDELGAFGADGPLAVPAQHLRGEVLLRTGDVKEARRLLVAAAETVAETDPATAVVMLAEAADACFFAGYPAGMLAPARRAFALLGEEAAERERFLAHLALGTALIADGADAEGAELLRRAVAILEASDVMALDPRLLSPAAAAPLWLREAGVGEALIERAIDAARIAGALGLLPCVLMLAARDAASADRWAIGRALYEEGIAAARESGQGLALCGSLAGLAMLEARSGHAEASAAAATEAAALAEHHGLEMLGLWVLDAQAELAMSEGRLDQAQAHLEAKAEALVALDLADPDLSPVPELAELALRRGTPAAIDLDAFVQAAETKGQPWSLARLARTRGLVADSEDEIQRHFAHALEQHAQTPDRFEEARTRVCFGERLRRAGHRQRAREQLRAALTLFEDLGAAPWAERASAELLATGERARRRDASTIDDLTPRELLVGTTVVAGHTTRETAAKLFLSPKTVEYHLRNAYRKLGIGSREELARALDPGAQD